MFSKLQRKRFTEGRTPLSDDDFASALGVEPDLQRFAVAARESLSRVCHVPAALIYPDDAPSSLARLAGDWDGLGVVLELESLLGIPVEGELPQFLGSRFFWRTRSGPSTFGEWAVSVARYLHERVHHNAA
jgi:hypothetical protein